MPSHPIHPHAAPSAAFDPRSHIATVMQVADAGVAAPAAARHDAVIRTSWQRCVHEHHLDPTRMQQAVVLPSARLREHREQMDAFLSIARHGLEALYRQVAGQGYVVLLTDARGITVDFIGDLTLEPQLRRAGLVLGADWSEHHAGTCGVGTCLSTGEALTVHLDDHFDATHIPLTCTAAPVYDSLGRLNAVLDISQLSSAQPKDSQHLALQLVKVYAQHVENAAFLQRHRRDWVLRLSEAPQFLDVNPDYLLALDAAGRVIGHNRRAQQLFEPGLALLRASLSRPSSLIGQPITALLDLALTQLGRYAPGSAVEPRAVLRHGTRHRLFLLAAPPPGPQAAQATQAAQVPSPTTGTGTGTSLGQRAPARAAEADTSAATSTLALATSGAEPSRIPAALAALSAGDAALDRQIERAARLVDSPVSLLITGETGSGKELFAKAMHRASARRAGPFVAVNCAAIPDSLIESELFGHLPGSFSGAGPKGKKGLIQAADGGTLFLDEIGDMPRALQARLLRVLAEHEVLPIGATRPVRVDLRVIAATHCPLEALVHDGRFRDDLYYRLNGAHVQLPPLRQRQDLDGLITRLLTEGAQLGPAPHPAPPELSMPARAALHAHPWPGNLRELRNALDYARTVCNAGVIQLGDLPEALQPGAPRPAGNRAPAWPATPAKSDHPAGGPGDPPGHGLPVHQVGPANDRAKRVTPGGPDPDADTDTAAPAEAIALLDALRRQRWNVSAVARGLGCSRMTLYRRMRRWGIRSPLD